MCHPPPQNCLLPRGSGPPSNTWFYGLIRAHNANGISIGTAVFAQLNVECPILYNGSPHPSWKSLIPMRDPDPVMVPWAYPSPQPKRHLDWFSMQFLHGSGSLLRQTDSRPRFSVWNNRPHTYIVRRCGLIRTSGQSNLLKRPHRRRRWTVQPYSPCGANVQANWTHGPKSTPQTASTRCVSGTPNFEGQTLVNMRFICTKISRPRHEVMLREVLPELSTICTAFSV